MDELNVRRPLVEIIAKMGVDYHPHSLKDPQPIVDFLLKNAYAR